MELQEKDYILGYWFASDKDDNCWYKMIVKRDGQWIGSYTFRYNESGEHDDPFSGKDRKSVYSFTQKGDMTECAVIENANLMFEVIKAKFNDYSDMFLVRGGIPKFFEIAKTKHYLHLKQVPSDKL